METSESKAVGTDPQVLADLEAVLERIRTGIPLDAEAARRIRERAERIREEIRQEHGELDVAVQLIRESRDQA